MIFPIELVTASSTQTPPPSIELHRAQLSRAASCRICMSARKLVYMTVKYNVLVCQVRCQALSSLVCVLTICTSDL